MSSFRFIILVCIIMGRIMLKGYGQQPVSGNDPQFQADMEEMMRSGNRREDLSDLIDYFSELQQHPININRANRTELGKLLFLNDFQITSLLDYREQTGNILSISELQLVFGFDQDVIRRILPFITLGPESMLNKNSGQSRPRWVQEGFLRFKTTVEKEAGYLTLPDSIPKSRQNAVYQGDRTGILFRYKVTYGQTLSAGILGDKDPGEPFFSGRNRQGFDFYSYYFQYNHTGVLRQVNLGHYHLRLGQGLVLWNGFRMSKSSDVMDINKRSPEVRVASSSAETGYLNGASVVLQMKNFTVVPFFSSKRIDAKLEFPDSGMVDPVITSFPETGLHRTAKELQNKQTAHEITSGMRISWRHNHLTVGVTTVYTGTDHIFRHRDTPDNLYDFQGMENINGGIDYLLSLKRISCFGEAAISRNLSWAALQGIQWYFSPLLSLSFLARYYQPGYFAAYSNAFTETGTTKNEEGIYLGINIHPIPHVSLSGYVDFYKFPWLRYQIDAPSSGTEARVILSWEPTDHLLFNAQYKNENKSHNNPDNADPMNGLIRQRQDHLRLQIRYALLPQLQATNRLDITRFLFGSVASADNGYMIYQDFRYTPEHFPITVYLRFGMFDTKFYTRIYTYENDLLYNFSTPSFTGQGIRWFMMLKYPVVRHANIGIRIAQTIYADREVTGTGVTRIVSPHKTEIKAQIRFRF